MRQDQRSTNRGQRVGGTDGKVDPGGDNDHGHPHRHDGKETRILSNLDQGTRIEELIDGIKGRNLLPIGTCLEDPFPFTFRIILKLWKLNRSAENGQ